MGILSEFFVASPEAAQACEDLIHTRAFEDQAAYTGFTGLELADLWAILAGTDYAPEQHLLESVHDAQDSWLERFPAPFVALLAGLDDQGLASAQLQWAASEELQLAPDVLRPVLEDLRRLAAKALAEGKGLYLWGSL